MRVLSEEWLCKDTAGVALKNVQANGNIESIIIDRCSRQGDIPKGTEI